MSETDLFIQIRNCDPVLASTISATALSGHFRSSDAEKILSAFVGAFVSDAYPSSAPALKHALELLWLRAFDSLSPDVACQYGPLLVLILGSDIAQKRTALSVVASYLGQVKNGSFVDASLEALLFLAANTDDRDLRFKTMNLLRGYFIRNPDAQILLLQFADALDPATNSLFLSELESSMLGITDIEIGHVLRSGQIAVVSEPKEDRKSFLVGIYSDILVVMDHEAILNSFASGALNLLSMSCKCPLAVDLKLNSVQEAQDRVLVSLKKLKSPRIYKLLCTKSSTASKLVLDMDFAIRLSCFSTNPNIRDAANTARSQFMAAIPYKRKLPDLLSVPVPIRVTPQITANGVSSQKLHRC